jgi:hypothetical protein
MIIKKSLLNERILDFLNDCRTVVRVCFRKINFYNVVFPSTKLKEKAALYKGNRLSKFIPNVTTYFMEKFCLPSLNSLSLHWHLPILILEHERKLNDVPLNHQDSKFYFYLLNSIFLFLFIRNSFTIVAKLSNTKSIRLVIIKSCVKVQSGFDWVYYI